jgi:hypothetical protein
LFFCNLDLAGQDYWLDREVSAWTTEKNIVVDHDINFPGNLIFGRKQAVQQASDGFVKSLFKGGNLDYHISLLRRKLSGKYGVTFCRKQNSKSNIVEYRSVMKDGCQCGWIGNSARNGLRWHNEIQPENTGEVETIDTKVIT